VAALSIQLSGVDIILYYSSLLLRHAGVFEPQLVTTCLGAAHATAVAGGMLLAPRLPRRLLLLYSWVALACCFAGLAASVWGCIPPREEDASLEGESEPEAEPWPRLAVASMVGVVVAGAVGPGAVGWSVVAERLPMYARVSRAGKSKRGCDALIVGGERDGASWAEERG
jgi:hypothetical protein